MWEIKTLGRADDERARDMLEKTAWQVQPIMRKRGWKVQELCEMKPEQRDRVGDNLNMGQRVRLKLRKNNSGDWFDYDHVVLVMLHELCHNDIGPHNAKFFKLLDEITVECEELMAKGIGGSGAGFDAKGQRLGHRRLGRNRDARSRKAAAEAAARRGVPGRHGTRGGQKTGRRGRRRRATAGPEGGGGRRRERRLRAEPAREHGDERRRGHRRRRRRRGPRGWGRRGRGREAGEGATRPRRRPPRCPAATRFGARGTTARWWVSSPPAGTRDAGKRKRASGRRADEDDDGDGTTRTRRRR